MDRRFLLSQEIADDLRTPEATVRYWRHTGSGPEFIKVGRRVLYPADAYEDWLRAQGVAPKRISVPSVPPHSRGRTKVAGDA